MKITHYVIAVILSIVVTLIKLYFPDIGEPAPFLLYIFVVIASAYVGGMGPGLMALITTILLCDYYFLPPTNSFNIVTGVRRIQLIAYIIEGTLSISFISALTHTRRQLARTNRELEERVKRRTKKLEEAGKQMEKLNTELQRSNRELADFAYVASHDLQEPLRKIQSFSNLLSEEYPAELEEEGQLYVDRIKKASTRMRQLIDDLLLYSRVTTKQSELQSVDLNEVIAGVLSDMEVIIKELNAQIHVAQMPLIKADHTQMTQLFQNLISNALRYRDRSRTPRIDITCDQDDTGYTIRVADNGIGFDPKYKERIFHIFERLHGKETYQGTGVGLAIVKKIILRHKGEITVESVPGTGTTFIISLPIHANAESTGNRDPHGR